MDGCSKLLGSASPAVSRQPRVSFGPFALPKKSGSLRFVFHSCFRWAEPLRTLLDTLRTHVRGVLVRNPDWESALAGFQAESAWMMGAWDDLQQITANNELTSPYIMKARVLLAMRAGDATQVASALSNARAVLGAPITAAGAKGYRQSYDALLDLHMIHEMELVYGAVSATVPRTQSRREAMNSLGASLAARFDATLPNFRVRQAVLSMRRTALALR